MKLKKDVKNFHIQISRRLILLMTLRTMVQDSTSLDAVHTTLNACALSTEFEISPWSFSCAGSTTETLP
jgi:hypothetical protein